jgi:hypothetical protein
MKIEVKYEPRKEVIIHEYTKYSSHQELIDASAKGLPAGSVLTALRWVGGVLLAFNAMQINPVTTQELIEGRLHWDHVSFASMPEYQEQVITNAGVTVVIGNVSGNPVFAEIAKFLRKEFLQKT